MKTEVLPYAVESLQKIYKQVCLVCEGGHGFFSVRLDEVEIVSKSDSPTRLNDLLFYDHESLSKITVIIYDLQGEYLNCYEIVDNVERTDLSDQTFGKEIPVFGKEGELNLFLLAKENEALRKENTCLRKKDLLEKIESVKVIDSGDCLVFFVPKSQVQEGIAHHVKQVSDELYMLKVIERYARRFVFKP